MDNKRIFLKFEKFDGNIELLKILERDEEKNFYAIGFASTPDMNSEGFVVENKALLDCWKRYAAEGRNIAVYEKHGLPIGKIVDCEEMSGKVLIAMEIPRSGNERVLALYEQGIYTGLSIGGWTLDGEWVVEGDVEIFHVTEFDWIETSWTDIPANENALLLEFAKTKKPQKLENKVKQENVITELEIGIALENITKRIRGID